MIYALLKLWVEENNTKSFVIKEVKKYKDQIAVFFKNQKKILQINFYPTDSFCFFTEKKILPFSQNPLLFTNQLTNYKINDILILPNDRIIKFRLVKSDIFNQEKILNLYVELIPFFGNLIITDQNDIIIDALKKIPISKNPENPVLPQMKYQKAGFNINRDLNFPIKLNEKFILNKKPDNVNLIFETLYYEHILKNNIEREIEKQRTKIRNQIKKKENKIKKLLTELHDYEKEKQYKLYLELIKANYSRIKKGMENIIVPNFFSEDYSPIKIPLNPMFNASQNLNYYAKKYKKSVSGRKKVQAQIEKTKNEIESLKAKIENIKFEFNDDKTAKKSKLSTSQRFKKIVVNDDWEIIFGRTKNENDFVTTKIAKPYDWWFHTRIFHGTHLVLRNLKKKQPSPELIKISASLAAYYSKAKKSENIPVDYTQVKYVRKPKGSPAGFVVYSRQKTIYVNPMDERLAKEFLKKI